MSTIKNVEGDELPEDRVKLAMYLIEHNVKINVNYDGCGDSGDFDAHGVRQEDDKWSKTDIPDIYLEIAKDIVCRVVNPNFNDDGSNGEAELFISDGKLVMTCIHNDIVTSYDTREYNDEILDIDKL
jgi:hypothetical protein